MGWQDRWTNLNTQIRQFRRIPNPNLQTYDPFRRIPHPNLNFRSCNKSRIPNPNLDKENHRIRIPNPNLEYDLKAESEDSHYDS